MEEKLGEGAWNEVHRTGNRVLRATRAWTPTVHELLKYLESVDFPWSPRVLGHQPDGREVLTFIDGVSVTRPWPAEVRRPEGLAPFVSVIRSYHEAVAGFAPRNDRWWLGQRPLFAGEIVCHGDLGLWNFLCRDGRVTGLIDWDGIQPGHELRDLAQFSFNAVPLQDDALAARAGFSAPPDRRARLEAILAAYPIASSSDVVAEVVRMLEEEHVETVEKGRAGVQPWAEFLARGWHEENRRNADWIAAHFDDLIT